MLRNATRMLTWSLAPVLALAVASAGCQSSEVLGTTASDVVTTFKPDRLTAGDTAEVACVILNGLGNEVDGLTTFTVSPDDGREVVGVGVTPTVSGTYVAVCSAPEYELVDPIGDELVVDPGAPSVVTTLLDPEVIPVYTTSAVTCVVEDVYGNIVPVEAEIAAPEDVTVGEGSVGSTVVGTYEIACVLPDYPDAEVVPAELEVVPADPAEVVLHVKPDADVYYIDGKADFWWVVTDVHGNQISGLPATFDVPDADVQVIDEPGHEYRLTAEGHFTFTVTLDPPWDGLTDSKTLIVDESGPDIVITWPTRGETVEGTGDFLTIAGYVTDAYGELEFFEINGDEVDVADDGSFETLMLPEWGVNVITAYAEDGFGNGTKISPTYAYSSKYVPVLDTDDAVSLLQTDAVGLLLGQDFLDDGDHDPEHLDDLATLLEVILGDADIGELISGFGSFDLATFPIIDQDILGGALHLGGEVKVTAGVVDPTDIGPTMVTIDSRLGGIDSIIEFGDERVQGLIITLAIEIEIPFVVSWDAFGGGEISLTGSASLLTEALVQSMMFATKLDMQKAPGGELQVGVSQLALELSELEIDPIQDIVLSFELDLGFWNPSFDLSLSQLVGDISQITDQFLDPITTQFVPFILDLVLPLLEGVVDDLVIQVLSLVEQQIPFPLPALIGPEVTLDMATELSSVQFFSEQVDGVTGELINAGGGQIGLGIGFHHDKAIDRDPIGAIQRGGCLKGGEPDGFIYDWDRSLGAAMKTDFLNAGAFAVWWSGYLNGELDLTGLVGDALPIPLGDPVVTMEWLLPPIWSDCGKSGALEIQIGDLLVDLKAEFLGSPVDATMYVDASLGLFFEATDEGLSIAIGDFHFFDVEVLYVSEDISELLDIKDLLENGLKDLLGGFIVGQSFGPIEIPPIDLGGLLPGLPAGAALQIGNMSVDREDGYVVFGADLE